MNKGRLRLPESDGGEVKVRRERKMKGEIGESGGKREGVMD